jgi:hypothetical protein
MAGSARGGPRLIYGAPSVAEIRGKPFARERVAARIFRSVSGAARPERVPTRASRVIWNLSMNSDKPDPSKSGKLKDLEELVLPDILRVPRTIFIYYFSQDAFVAALKLRNWEVLCKPVFFLTTSSILLSAVGRYFNSEPLNLTFYPWLIKLIFCGLIPFALLFHVMLIICVNFNTLVEKLFDRTFPRIWGTTMPVTFTSLFAWCYIFGIFEIQWAVYGIPLTIVSRSFLGWYSKHKNLVDVIFLGASGSFFFQCPGC